MTNRILNRCFLTHRHVYTGASHHLNRPPSINSLRRRSISQWLHIKGLPTQLSRDEIYEFMQEYGDIEKLACYEEAPNLNPEEHNDKKIKDVRRRNFILHERPPGQTAVVKFEQMQSAIMCKEELHWRPFPVDRYQLGQEIISTNAKNRPLVNILFQTFVLKKNLRPWVIRDLDLSAKWIENRKREEGQDAKQK